MNIKKIKIIAAGQLEIGNTVEIRWKNQLGASSYGKPYGRGTGIVQSTFGNNTVEIAYPDGFVGKSDVTELDVFLVREMTKKEICARKRAMQQAHYYCL